MAVEKTHIYLDYGATTPMDQQVLDAMQPFFRQNFGNPASVHYFGQRAETALESARQNIADHLGAKSGEIIFTSGGTESDNLALKGTALAARRANGANHVLISGVEHHGISRTAQQLSELYDFDVEVIKPDNYGKISVQAVEDRLRAETAIVSILMANNEVGTINPIKEIAARCRARQIPLHTDAVQAGAYLPINVDDLGISLLSLGAHKFYGPKGTGVLYVREGSNILPLQTGGSHEFDLRAGTPNTAYIVGMAEAFGLVQNNLEKRSATLISMRDRIIKEVLAQIPDSQLSGHPSERLPNHASFVFKGVDGNALLMHLDAAGFACSSGSACKTGDPEPSDVLLAMGLDREWALGSLRVTVGIHTLEDEISAFIDVLPKLVQNFRQSETD